MVALRSEARRRRLPPVPVDLLPDRAEYRDTGCELSPSCLRCPLPRCKYDEPRRVTGAALHRRNREIALLFERYHAPVALLADTYKLSRRQLFRILEEQGVTTACKGARRRDHRDTRGRREMQLAMPEMSA